MRLEIRHFLILVADFHCSGGTGILPVMAFGVDFQQTGGTPVPPLFPQMRHNHWETGYQSRPSPNPKQGRAAPHGFP